MSEWISKIKPSFGVPLNRQHWGCQGLVAHYGMQEGCGDLVHDSCGMNDGKMIGMAPMSGASGWVPGPHGGALAFNRTYGDNVSCGNNLSIWANTNVTTIVHIYPTLNTGANQAIVAKVEANNTFELYIHIQQISFWDGITEQWSTYAVTLNKWVSIAAVRSGAKVDLYVDGGLINYNKTIGMSGGTSYLNLGNDRYNQYFNGLISSVSIYNRALSAEEIAYLYAFPWCMYDRGSRAFYRLPLPAFIPPYYEPYIADNGIPSLSQETQSIHWGASQISSGSVILLNGRGFFDQIARRWIWNNKDAKLLLGGDSLPYSEYTCSFAGKILESSFTKNDFTLQIESKSFALLRSLPINNFWTSTWANLDPQAEGKPIPYYWGSYSAAQAPLVTCINSAYTPNDSQWKICDCAFHPIKSITQVYIDYGAGSGWQTIAHANADLANATFTIAVVPVLGTTRVKVAFEGYHSGGVLIEGAPEIIEDLLLNQCGYAAADLNAASFTASKALSNCTLNAAVERETEALTIIETACQSDLAFFDEDGEGLLRYRTWEPSASGTIPVLAKEEILEPPEILDDSSKLYWKVKVGYSWMGDTDQPLYTEASTTTSKYKYSRNDYLTIDTYLRSKADADQLAGRLNWITRDPSPVISLTLKAGQIDKTLGDKVKVTLARAPYSTAGGYDERVFEIISKEVSCFPLLVNLKGRDLMDFGNNVGFWMGDSAPAWLTATAQEKEDSGFWCDANGYCLTADSASLNKSLWW